MESTRPWDVADYLKTEADIDAYLEAALGDIAKAKGEIGGETEGQAQAATYPFTFGGFVAVKEALEGFAQKVLFRRDFLCRLPSCTRIYSNTQLKCSLDNFLEMVAD